MDVIFSVYHLTVRYIFRKISNLNILELVYLKNLKLINNVEKKIILALHNACSFVLNSTDSPKMIMPF